VIELLAALVLAPWVHPLAFHPLAGWQTGLSGNTRSAYVGPPGNRAKTPLESSAWIARNVRYRDDATADPPNKTLRHLPRSGVIVWAVIYNPAQKGEQPIRLDLGAAKRFACCEGAYVAGGEYELSGSDPGRTYSVIVRIYFGSRPTSALRAEAQRALNRLHLPASR
jgi:hypothetical protein